MTSGQLAGHPDWLRPVEVIETDRALCAKSLDRPHGDHDLAQGSIDAYDWLLGRGLAPLSGEPIPLTIRTVAVEQEKARDVLYRRTGAVMVSRSYAVAVEHALMWAREESTDSPGGQEDEDEDDFESADSLTPDDFR